MVLPHSLQAFPEDNPQLIFKVLAGIYFFVTYIPMADDELNDENLVLDDMLEDEDVDEEELDEKERY